MFKTFIILEMFSYSRVILFLISSILAIFNLYNYYKASDKAFTYLSRKKFKDSKNRDDILIRYKNLIRNLVEKRSKKVSSKVVKREERKFRKRKRTELNDFLVESPTIFKILVDTLGSFFKSKSPFNESQIFRMGCIPQDFTQAPYAKVSYN